MTSPPSFQRVSALFPCTGDLCAQSSESADKCLPSETETFIALKCLIDHWRWAGVPFYLRTGKRMAEGQRIISIALREPPKSMFPSAMCWRPTNV